MTLRMAHASPRCRSGPPRGRGFVLLVALGALALLGLAGVALMRALDTATAVTGNLGLRDAAVAPANGAIEDAIAALFENGAIADRERDAPVRGYYASRLPGEDARGVPLLLQSPVSATNAVRTIDAGAGNTLRYVIERLCLGPGPATAAACNLALEFPPPSSPAGAVPTYPIYRVTARVDGPQQAVVHVQMMLRESSPPRRLSWRVLAE